MRWDGHVAHRLKARQAHNILLEIIVEGGQQVVKRRRKREKSYKNVNWIEMARENV
jgi:hypothetical protein